MTLAATIARFAARADLSGFPPEVVAAARRSILDALSVAVAGSQTGTARAARAALLGGGEEGDAAVLGTALRGTASTAALLNGIAGHALDYDDVWADDDGVRAWRGHPSVCVLPACLAVAEAAGRPGRTVLEAYIVGVEIAGKLGSVFGPDLGRAGWHPTVVLGTVAAAAAAGRVLGLDPGRLEIALGIAATEAGGLHRNFGTDTKPFHAGHAARCGVDAALLAGAGFTANPNAVADYVRVFGGDPATAVAVADELGASYELATCGLAIKKYPCCRFAHLPVDAALDLVAELSAGPEAVEEILVRIQPGADDALVCPDARTGLEGKFSLPYAIAASVVDRRLSLGSFTDAAVLRPEVRRLMSRVRTEHRGDPGAEVVITASGASISRRATVVRGDPANPLSPEEELDKCRSCLEGVVGGSAADRLVAMVSGLADLRSAAEVVEVLRPQVGANATLGSAAPARG
jgi:2-methylcitrate dehydratase PrpD